MYRGTGLGALDPCDAKRKLGIPEYPYGKKSMWTEDAQRYANKTLSASNMATLPVTGVLDDASCRAFGMICDEWKRQYEMGPSLTLDSVSDTKTCDRMPCVLLEPGRSIPIVRNGECGNKPAKSSPVITQPATPVTEPVTRRPLLILPNLIFGERATTPDNPEPSSTTSSLKWAIAAGVAAIGALAIWKWSK